MKYSIYIFALALACAIVYSAPETVIINSYEWQDLYLGSVYAGMNDAEIFHFQGLADAQIKTRTMSPTKETLVLESARRPVVKNYEKFLSVNEFTNYEVKEFSDFSDLQRQLFLEDQPEKIIILYSKFGTEAIVSSPLTQNGYTPLFLTEQNKKELISVANAADEVVVSGYFPVRLINGMPSTQEFTELPKYNIQKLTNLMLSQEESEWAILARPDQIDIEIIKQNLPIFLYVGDVVETAALIRDSGVTHFEVIGGNMANVATAIESETGQDLKYLLKYARTVTGISGLEGQILDIDAVYFDFIAPEAVINDVTYYPNLELLAVTFENTGNVPVSLFSNIDFAQNALADDYIYIIPEGKTATIVYPVTDPGPDVQRTVITTQYGIGEELDRNILAENGLPVVTLNATIDERTDISDNITIQNINLNTETGLLQFILENPNNYPVVATAAVVINTTESQIALLSEQVELNANGIKSVSVELPYIENEILLGEQTVLTLHGKEDTLQTSFTSLQVVANQRSDNTTVYVLIGAGVLILVLIIVFLWWRKR